MAKIPEHTHIHFNPGGPVMPPKPYTTVMVGGRVIGKTTSLVEALRWDPDGVLVVHSQRYADDLEREYPHLRGRVTGPSREKVRARIDSNIYIDNAELVLSNLLGGGSIKGMTINGRAIK